MKKYTKPRKFSMPSGVHLELSWHVGLGLHMAQIYVPDGSSQAVEYEGFSPESPLRAFKQARLKMRLHQNPKLREVYEKLNPSGVYGESIIESLRRMKEKLLMSDAKNPPKRLFMNRRMADKFLGGISIFQEPGRLAGLNMPVVIIDDALPDNTILKEEKE